MNILLDVVPLSFILKFKLVVLLLNWQIVFNNCAWGVGGIESKKEGDYKNPGIEVLKEPKIKIQKKQG